MKDKYERKTSNNIWLWISWCLNHSNSNEKPKSIHRLHFVRLKITFYDWNVGIENLFDGCSASATHIVLVGWSKFNVRVNWLNDHESHSFDSVRDAFIRTMFAGATGIAFAKKFVECVRKQFIDKKIVINVSIPTSIKYSALLNSFNLNNMLNALIWDHVPQKNNDTISIKLSLATPISNASSLIRHSRSFAKQFLFE